MLFAASRLTLVRELGTSSALIPRPSKTAQPYQPPGAARTGTEHFSETVFATSKTELTAAGWSKHEAHTALSAPLTEEERNLAGIREAEAQESRGTGARSGGHVGSSVALPIDDDALSALREIGAGQGGVVQLVSFGRYEYVQETR